MQNFELPAKEIQNYHPQILDLLEAWEEDTIPITWPTIDDPNMTDEEKLEEFIRRLFPPQMFPNIEPGTRTRVCPECGLETELEICPDCDTPTIPKPPPDKPPTKPEPPPPPPSGTVFALFPFCIPWDVYYFVEAITATPVEPVFEFHIFPPEMLERYGGSVEPIVLDFSMFETPRQIVRWGFLILWVIALIGVTKRFIWTGGS